MHEGKHGILDGLEDMDDIFGIDEETEEKEKDTKKKKSFLGFGKKD